jgi:hypothetical protein
MKSRSFVAVLSCVCAVTVFAQSGAMAASKVIVARHGTVGIRLVASPGTPSKNPLASSYIVAQLKPGTKLTRAVEIDNDSKKYVDVSVYVAAASIVRGHFVFAPGAQGNELARWTTVGKTTLRLAPDSQAFDTLITKVPLTSVKGNNYAVVWAAVSAAPPRGSGITMVSRVGVRMYVAVGPGGAAPSNFIVTTLSTEREKSGDSLLVTRIRNSGANTLDLNGILTLSKGPDGLHAGPFTAKLGVVLAPGASEPVAVVFAPSFPRGPWRADLKVSSGELQRSTIATISFPSRHDRHDSSRKLPVLLFVVLVLLAVGSLFVVKRLRRRPKHFGTFSTQAVAK